MRSFLKFAAVTRIVTQTPRVSRKVSEPKVKGNFLGGGNNA